MVETVFVLYNIIFKWGIIMIHLHNHSFAPPPWRPCSDRVRGLSSEEGVNEHLPYYKEGVL